MRRELQVLFIKRPLKNLKQVWAQSNARKYRFHGLMSTMTLKYASKLVVFSIVASLICPGSDCSAQSRGEAKSDTLSLCFLSDTQDPMTFERVFLSYNNNARARSLIFAEIVEGRPKSVVHLGDLVAIGSSGDSWKDVDRFVKTLHERQIEFSPIPGNHDYLMFSKKGVSHFSSRFLHARLSGYTRQYANVGIVLINSNFDELSNDESDGQLRWYRKTLADYENNPSIDFVIVGSHHPPFTNSKIVAGSEEIRDRYLPEYYQSGKCRLFLSGHAHAFEHFRVNGKDFLVIGGSGGLQHPLRTGTEAEYHDLFSNSLEKRMFHFLTVESHDSTLTVEVRMLRSDFGGFDRLPQLKFVREKQKGEESRE